MVCLDREIARTVLSTKVAMVACIMSWSFRISWPIQKARNPPIIYPRFSGRDRCTATNGSVPPPSWKQPRCFFRPLRANPSRNPMLPIRLPPRKHGLVGTSCPTVASPVIIVSGWHDWSPPDVSSLFPRPMHWAILEINERKRPLILIGTFPMTSRTLKNACRPLRDARSMKSFVSTCFSFLSPFMEVPKSLDTSGEPLRTFTNGVRMIRRKQRLHMPTVVLLVDGAERDPMMLGP
mmetsp:Transcript_18688/g.43366  ORF Transcript_18688/g.43366 Transcript_18688/m.43366 type:complete len:236 (+) Transcript_18688:359-1066(+)